MEKWKAIKGYEGIYEVSNLGRVRSKNGEITPHPNSTGYLRVQLSKNGEKHRFFVHRLVADAFVTVGCAVLICYVLFVELPKEAKQKKLSASETSQASEASETSEAEKGKEESERKDNDRDE